MRNLSFVLFVLISSTIYSQSDNQTFAKVLYNVYFNVEIPNTRKAILEINLIDNTSVFVTLTGDLQAGSTVKDNTISLVEKGSDRYVKTLSDKRAFLVTEKFKNQDYLLHDTIPELLWDISHEEVKKIGESTCNKATATFRGRNFIAWYDVTIPLNYGPWKFNNLPGLILEIYDETKRFNWQATAILYSDKSEVVFPVTSNAKIIVIKDYANLRYKQMESSVMSQLPRGVDTKTINPSRNGIEIKFEWE
jgi:GLPGLI family protein